MNPQDTPFEPGWWSFGLGEHRPCNATYCLSDYDILPPLPEVEFDGSLQWLRPLPDALDEELQVYRPPEEARIRQQALLDNLIAMAVKLNLKLPEAFIKLMRSVELQNRIPSCTACFFDLPERIVPDPAGAGGYMLRFLVDQQWVLCWYLYLKPDGDHCVVVSPFVFDNEIYVDEFASDPDQAVAQTRYCGPDFEAFLYRFWLENTIWFALNDAPENLTDQQAAYLAHYL